MMCVYISIISSNNSNEYYQYVFFMEISENLRMKYVDQPSPFTASHVLETGFTASLRTCLEKVNIPQTVNIVKLYAISHWLLK